MYASFLFPQLELGLKTILLPLISCIICNFKYIAVLSYKHLPVHPTHRSTATTSRIMLPTAAAGRHTGLH